MPPLLKPQYLTYPHVQVSAVLAAVVQHQVGVSIVESSHHWWLQQHGLHLLHPPHPQTLITNLRAKLTRGGLEGEHAAKKDSEGKEDKNASVTETESFWLHSWVKTMWVVADRRGRGRGIQEAVVRFFALRRCSELKQSHMTLVTSSISESVGTNWALVWLLQGHFKGWWWWKDLNGVRIETPSQTPPNNRRCGQMMSAITLRGDSQSSSSLLLITSDSVTPRLCNTWLTWASWCCTMSSLVQIQSSGDYRELLATVVLLWLYLLL